MYLTSCFFFFFFLSVFAREAALLLREVRVGSCFGVFPGLQTFYLDTLKSPHHRSVYLGERGEGA